MFNTMIGATVGNVLYLQMKKLGDVFELVIGHTGEGRHAFFGAAILQERDQMLAMVVAQHNVRGDQAGTRRAMSLRPVAKGAVLLK